MVVSCQPRVRLRPMSAELAVAAGIVAMAVLLGAAVWLWRRGAPNSLEASVPATEPRPAAIDSTRVLAEPTIAPTEVLAVEPATEVLDRTEFVPHAGPPRGGFDDDDEGTVFTARAASSFVRDE